MKTVNTLSISFQELFENSQIAAIILMDKNGTILNSNIGVLKSYGYAPEDLQGKNASILFTREDQLKNLPEIELTRVMQQHSSIDHNYIVHKDGSYIWTQGETILTKDENEELILVKIMYDIHEQKLQEKHLILANEELTRINQELDNFVYSASHDLKAPINNIEALITTIEEELDETARKNLSYIIDMLKQSVDKFKKTIADLSVSGREIASNKQEKPIPITEVIKEVKQDLQEEIKKSNAIFIENFKNISSINISKKNLRSVLYNLISNAIKYRSVDRIPEIRISAEKSNGFISIEVSDNGLGIRKDDQNKIFDLYSRLHTHVEGTGVGMNLVKNIVDNIGGKIEIESEEGKGSAFKVYIPN